MKTLKRLAVASALAVSLIGATSASAAELITNGSFETNDGGVNATGWSWTPTMTIANDVGFTGSPVYDGSWSLLVGEDTAVEYHQSITTNIGSSYVFSYAYYSDGLTPNVFQSWFGSQPGQALTNIGLGDGDGWYTYTNTFVASAASTDIYFVMGNSNAGSGYLQLDAVSVTDAPENPVPEIDAVAGTAAITLLLGTMSLVSGRHRRRS